MLTEVGFVDVEIGPPVAAAVTAHRAPVDRFDVMGLEVRKPWEAAPPDRPYDVTVEGSYPLRAVWLFDKECHN